MTLTALEKLAVEVALVTPLRKNQWAVSASVPWVMVNKIRAELERVGIDWRALHAKTREIQQERRTAAAT